MTLSALASHARAELSTITDGAVRAKTEEILVTSLLEFSKQVSNNRFDGQLDGLWQMQRENMMRNAAFGDGKILEQLIKLLEIILPILLQILFPDET